MSNFMPFQKLPKLILCFISFLVFCLCAQDAVPELVQSPLALVTSVPEELTSNDIKNLQQFLGKVTAETRNKVPDFLGIEYMSRVRNIEMLVLKKQIPQARAEYIRIVNELTEFRVKAGVKPPVASVPKTKTVEDEIVQLRYEHTKGNNEALIKLKEIAENNNSLALFTIGEIYLEGIKVGKSEIMAEQYFERSDLPKAKSKLMSMYFNRASSLYNPQKGMKILEEMAEAGDMTAMIKLARYAEFGVFMKKNLIKAQNYYIRLAKIGYVPAIAYCIENGLNGKNANPQEALRMYYDTAKNDKSIAGSDAAFLYVRLSLSLNMYSIKSEKIKDMLKIATSGELGTCAYYLRDGVNNEGSGHLDGILLGYMKRFNLSYAAIKEKEYSQMLESIKNIEDSYNLADAYLVHAIVQISNTLMYKRRSLFSDELLAINDLFKKIDNRLGEINAPLLRYAAEVLITYSQGRNALINLTDLSIDPSKMIKYAAESGDAKAQVLYASQIQNEHPVEAFNFFKKASGCMMIEALYHCGMCYLSGTGVEKNEKLAFEYLSKAVVQFDNLDSPKTFFASAKDYAMLKLRIKSELACCYAAGIGCEKKVHESDELYRSAVGMIESTFPTEKTLITDDGIKEWVTLTKKCAECKVPSAIFILGLFVLPYNGKDFFPAEYERAEDLKWGRHDFYIYRLDTPELLAIYKQAGINTAGLGNSEDIKQGILNAVKIWNEGVKVGNPESTFALARIFILAKQNDAAEGLLKKAIEMAQRINPKRYSIFIEACKEIMRTGCIQHWMEYGIGLDVYLNK